MRFLFLLPALLALVPPDAHAQTPLLSITQREVNRFRYAISARTSDGDQNCGPGMIVSSGWEVHLEQYFQFVQGNTILTQFSTTGGCGGTCFSNGVITIPRNGIYWLSGWGRCERNACDVTLRFGGSASANGGTIMGAFGTDRIQRWENDGTFIGAYWSTHGVSVMRYLTANQQVWMVMESGSTNDCLYDTNFFYGHLNAMLYVTDTE